MWSISSTLFDYTVPAIVTDTFWIVVFGVAGLNMVRIWPTDILTALVKLTVPIPLN